MSTSDFDIGHVVCWISEVSIVSFFQFFFPRPWQKGVIALRA